jgi:hypothetical protein
MDVSCKSCGAKLTIPNEKLPPHQAVTISCPKCKGKIRIEARGLEKDLASIKEEFEEAGLEYEEDTGPLDLLEEGASLALVLDGNETNVMEINSALEELSYKSILPSSIGEAMGKLRFHHFDLIFLSDGFDGQDLERSAVIHYLNHLSMSIRRKIFLVLSSEKLKTLDNMMAFAKSANLVVNPDDLHNLPLILKKAISDHERFYKIFADTLKEVGKD